MAFSWSLGYVISGWIIRIIMLVVLVFRKRRPTAALAWLAIIFFQPWVGLVLYVLIGEYRIPRRRTRAHAAFLRKLRQLDGQSHLRQHVLNPRVSTEIQPAVRLAESLGRLPILGGNAIELLYESHASVDRLIADIDGAGHHVHLLFYIYADDDTGRQVAGALMRAARRGVRCRLLVDHVGSRSMLRSLAPQLREAGVEVRPALPVGIFRRGLARIDVRNHRKVAIIDGGIAFCGSQNIINADYANRRGQPWYDVMVRIAGPVVLELQSVFLSDWTFGSDEPINTSHLYPQPACPGNVPIQTLPSGPNYPTENYQRMTVAAIHAARERVWLTTPYFVPDEPFLQALETAAARGADVKVVLPRRSDLRLVELASQAFYPQLLEAGIEVYLFQPGLLHAKTLVVDDELTFIASSNFDIRSFELNFELNLLLYGPTPSLEVRRVQQLYFARSHQLKLAEYNDRHPAVRFAHNLAKLLSPLL